MVNHDIKESLASLKERFEATFGRPAQRQFFAPGRINLIGEHIDYLGGTVLPAAIDRGITALATLRNDRTVRLRSIFGTSEQESITGIDIDIDSISEAPPKQHSKDHPPWVDYCLGMIRHYNKNYSLLGFDVLFSSNLPVASGLSSSAALEVLTGYLFLMIQPNQQPLSESDRVALAVSAQKIENEYIQVQCGIMDQFAVAMGRQDHAIHLNTSSLTYHYIAMPKTPHSWIVLNSNRPRKLTESKYNERRHECDQLLAMIQSRHSNVKNLTAINDDQLSVLKNEPVLFRRARHAMTENQRVLQAVNYLQSKSTTGQLQKLGELLCQSHDSLANDYEVSSFELNTLQDVSLGFDACVGARMTGAGFGGCAIALLNTNDQDAVSEFCKKVSYQYKEKTNYEADVFQVELSNGVL